MAFSCLVLASPVVDAIHAAYVRNREQGRRGYLGASVIGEDCSRKLWYEFHWAAAPEEFDGRKLRLFATGHREEERMVADLRMAGMTVLDVDPETKEQYAISDVGGHFKGHTDGRVLDVPMAEKTWHQLECKTHNDQSFKVILKLGVRFGKPQHYDQMQTYMHKEGLTRALYMAHNKDTDELHIERVEYDMVHAMKIIAKATMIITTPYAPPKLHSNPKAKMAFVCGYCTKKGICHEDEWAPRNCRTCLHSTAELDGDARWSCALHKVDLTIEDQRAGCSTHRFLPDLVPGKQSDVDPDGQWVEYVLRDGSTWRDGE